MPQTRRAKQVGSAALDRLRASIEAAETALKDLQGEVSRDSRDLLKDVGKTLTTARRNLTRSRGRIVKDLEQIQQALVKGKAMGTVPKRPAKKRPAKKRPASVPRGSAARSSKAGRQTSSTKPTAKGGKVS
jgi:acyl transferase domain-containing protein